MISPPTLDFDALLRPIDGDVPTGEDLRADPSPLSPYYQIKDARAAARAAERAGTQFEDGQQLVSADWRKVLELGPEILATKAKDLEIAAWLTEALVRQHGFAGLRDGFRLALGLIENFWDHLYPAPDEDGISTRVAPLAGLNGSDSEGTLSVPIALAPITAYGEFGCFGLWRYAKARELSKADDPAVVADALASGVATLEQFEATVRATDADFFRALAGDVDAAIEHFGAMTAVLDEKCGHDSPPSSSIRNTLADAKQTITFIVQEVAGVMLEEPDADEGEPEAETGSDGESARPAARATGEINNRDDAFRLLGRVAEYFRQSEPHSPLSSLLKQAVRWGRMPLEQLIEELIPDSEARGHFGLMTGIRSHGSEEHESE